MECYLETEDQIEARFQKVKAAYEAQQNNDLQGDGDVVDKIMGRIAGNAADHLADKIEEKTEGIIDKETIDMAIGALLEN